MPARIEDRKLIARAERLRRAGHSFAKIGKLLGISHGLAHKWHKASYFDGKAIFKRQRRAKRLAETVDDRTIAIRQKEIPLDTRNLTASTFGDPVFERSALAAHLRKRCDCDA